MKENLDGPCKHPTPSIGLGPNGLSCRSCGSVLNGEAASAGPTDPIPSPNSPPEGAVREAIQIIMEFVRSIKGQRKGFGYGGACYSGIMYETEIVGVERAIKILEGALGEGSQEGGQK